MNTLSLLTLVSVLLFSGVSSVVNGGGDYIGEVIDAKVLSVKHTSSGRMIFCNAEDEESHDHPHHYDDNDDLDR